MPLSLLALLEASIERLYLSNSSLLYLAGLWPGRMAPLAVAAFAYVRVIIASLV